MKITILGASGRTGIPLVRQALAKGYEVVALVRDPAKLTIQDDRLSVIQGNVQNSADVEQAVAGSDAVLLALGQTKISAKDVMTVAARSVISAMQKEGVARLITLTGAGVPYPAKDEPKLFNRVMSFLLKTLARDVQADSLQHVALIEQSGLVWTVVRVPMLTEDAHTGQIKVGYVGKGTGARIGRADVADFMLRVLEEDSHKHDMPMISN